MKKPVRYITNMTDRHTCTQMDKHVHQQTHMYIHTVFCPGYLVWWLDYTMICIQYTMYTISVAYICIIWEVVTINQCRKVWAEHCTQTDRQTDRHTQRYRHTHTCTQTDRESHIHTYLFNSSTCVWLMSVVVLFGIFLLSRNKPCFERNLKTTII